MKNKMKQTSGKTHKRKFKIEGGIKGGVQFHYENVFQKPSWQKSVDGLNNWVTFVKLKDTQLYATSIPSEDLYKCLANLSFYMHVKDIKRIISLQGCDIDDRHFTMNCHGRITPYKFDKNYESRMWIGMQSMYKEMQEDSYIDFQNHKIRDYTAGTLTTWFALFNYNYMDTNQKTLIHCLAGFGRTGSILLLIFMYNNYNNRSEKHGELSESFLGHTNGLDLFLELSVSFLDAIELDTSPENGKVNEDIGIFDIADIVKEVFDISNYSHANIFITRMNYIRICLGLNFGIKEIFLYKLWLSHTDSSFITPNTIFSSEGREMDNIKLSDIETISSQVDNPYGITV